ncbi:hypothetical protein [Pedobacter cryotolerans]|uniref:Uncharacterized protein n=1 Tax=Pedobacter cryotolerans TaxID=2571270 RepID=A0A4U1CBT0_9SPHI|nr:hypothetical protein [Pedobacter cryotolerans]TKC01240.1 hypothetical protein FA045_08320 [Pedobacter cryotolerans]
MNNKLMQLATERLKKVNYQEYQNCVDLTKGRLHDINLIPLIFQEVIRTYPANPENTPFILGVIYYLYAPYKLHFTDLRLQNGMRQIIISLMNWNDAPTVNYYADRLVAYYKNPRFAARVHAISDEIYEALKEFDS